MSQSQFAEATGLSQRSISRYEQATDDAEVKRPVLLSWAFATNVPVIWLQTGSTSPQRGDSASGFHRGYAPPLGRVLVGRFRPEVAA
jgi:transcriptional regulator with XRE-family HTH domain